MNRFVPAAGSMASIYGMQAAMDEEGKWNMLFSFVLGAVAKIFGKNGVFYARCRQASLIDDVTGTMPPFDKCLVYGPADTDNVCEKIKKATGAYGAVIADVNDLKRAAVLGKSQGLSVRPSSSQKAFSHTKTPRSITDDMIPLKQFGYLPCLL